MLRNAPNRSVWYESLDDDKVEDKKIILAEFVIEDLQLIPESFSTELRKGPIVVYFKLLDLPPIEFRQEFILECMSQTCDFYRTGKAVVLSLSQLPEVPPTMVDLEVEIKREVQECACVHEFPLAMTKIDLNPLFSELRSEYVVSPCKVPLIKFQKDWYILTTDESGAMAAGTIDVSIRLSCFDDLAVSQMTIGTREAVLSIVPKRLKRKIYTCEDFEHLDPIKLCSAADDPFEACDLSRYMLDGIMTAATSGIPDDIDNWIALAQHQGWKPQPRPIIEKEEAEAILSKICPDECYGFKARYPRPRYSQIRGDTTKPTECTEVCPTYEDALKPFPTCPKKRKQIEEFLKNRKPCPDICPLCYFDHDPPILPAKFHIPVFTEHYGEEGDESFPFPFEYYPFPYQKEDEPLAGDPEACDISCPWWSTEGKEKRQRKSYQFTSEGLRYERKKCPEQCPDCFYDPDFPKSSSSSSSNVESPLANKRRDSKERRKDRKRKSATYSSSSSNQGSTSSSQQSGRKSPEKVDCKCVHPDTPPENKYPCLHSYHVHAPKQRRDPDGDGDGKRGPKHKSQQRGSTSRPSQDRKRKSSTYSISSSSSNQESTSSSQQSGRKSPDKVDCKCVHPDTPPENKYPCLRSYHKNAPKQRRDPDGEGDGKRGPKRKSQQRGSTSRPSQDRKSQLPQNEENEEDKPQRKGSKRDSRQPKGRDSQRRSSSKRKSKQPDEDDETHLLQNEDGKLDDSESDDRERGDSMNDPGRHDRKRKSKDRERGSMNDPGRQDRKSKSKDRERGSMNDTGKQDRKSKSKDRERGDSMNDTGRQDRKSKIKDRERGDSMNDPERQDRKSKSKDREGGGSTNDTGNNQDKERQDRSSRMDSKERKKNQGDGK